jgi:RHS repeat-associated protein
LLNGTEGRPDNGVEGGGQPVLQFDGNGNLTVRCFANAQEGVTSLNQAGTVYWMAADQQGSVRDVVDNNGNLVDHIVYTTAGQTAYESNSSIPHWAGYAGEHLSPGSSLIISGARWYDAATGTWLTQDPVGFTAGDVNLSRYVGGGLGAGHSVGRPFRLLVPH